MSIEHIAIIIAFNFNYIRNMIGISPDGEQIAHFGVESPDCEDLN